MKERWLPLAATGEALFSIGISETEAGSAVTHMRARLTPDGPPGPERAGVPAQRLQELRHRRPQGALLPGVVPVPGQRGREGHRRGARRPRGRRRDRAGTHVKMGLRGTSEAELAFDDVRIEPEDVLLAGRCIRQRVVQDADLAHQPRALRKRGHVHRCCAGRARVRRPVHERADDRRAAARQAPRAPVEDRRHGDAARGRSDAAPASAPPRRPARHAARPRDRHGEVRREPRGEVRVRRGDPAPGRVRLLAASSPSSARTATSAACASAPAPSRSSGTSSGLRCCGARRRRARVGATRSSERDAATPRHVPQSRSVLLPGAGRRVGSPVAGLPLHRRVAPRQRRPGRRRESPESGSTVPGLAAQVDSARGWPAGRGGPARRRRRVAGAELVGGGRPVPGVLAPRRDRRPHPPPRRAEPTSSTCVAILDPKLLPEPDRRPWSRSPPHELARGLGPGRRLGRAPERPCGRALHLRVDWRTEGSAAHPTWPRLQGARHGRRSRAHAERLGADARAARAHLGIAQRHPGPRGGPDAGRGHGEVGPRRRARHDRAGAHHVHDRTTDVLRRADGHTGLPHRKGRLAPPRVERRRRCDTGVRRGGRRRGSTAA